MAGKISAGLLVYRRRGGEIEVLLAHPGGPLFAKKDAGAWTIPKGETEGEEEDLLERARIEFREEVGVPAPGGPYLELGAVTQKGGKRVHAWACEGEFEGVAQSNTFEMEWPPRSGKMREFPEVDRVEWFGVEEARGKLNGAQVELVERLLGRIG
jgi:predicted NUDIX family NTP pyrophosphohydrolase